MSIENDDTGRVVIEKSKTKRKSSLRARTEYWMVRVLLVTVPAFFTYLQVRTEAKDKAKSEAASVKRKAEAGYDELAEAVSKLQADLREERERGYTLEGHLQAVETYLRVLSSMPARPSSGGVGSGAASRPVFSPPAWSPRPPLREDTQLPSSLDIAAHQKNLP